MAGKKEPGAVTGKETVEIEYIQTRTELGIVDGAFDEVHENIFDKLQKKGLAIKKGDARPKAKKSE